MIRSALMCIALRALWVNQNDACVWKLLLHQTAQYTCEALKNNIEYLHMFPLSDIFELGYSAPLCTSRFGLSLSAARTMHGLGFFTYCKHIVYKSHFVTLCFHVGPMYDFALHFSFSAVSVRHRQERKKAPTCNTYEETRIQQVLGRWL